MTPEEKQIIRIEKELDGARQDLQKTLSTVEAKMEQQVEFAEVALQPHTLLQDNLIAASCVAGVLGFLVGSSRLRKVGGAAILAGLGYVIWSEVARRASDHDGGESAHS